MKLTSGPKSLIVVMALVVAVEAELRAQDLADSLAFLRIQKLNSETGQPSLFGCHGVLIEQGRVVTAGHCLDGVNLNRCGTQVEVVFYNGESEEKIPCRSVEQMIFQPQGHRGAIGDFYPDIAIMTLEREAPASARPVRRMSRVTNLPEGASLQIPRFEIQSPGTRVQEIECRHHDTGVSQMSFAEIYPFLAFHGCEIERGHSGAPIFYNGSLIGVVTQRVAIQGVGETAQAWLNQWTPKIGTSVACLAPDGPEGCLIPSDATIVRESERVGHLERTRIAEAQVELVRREIYDAFEWSMHLLVSMASGQEPVAVAQPQCVTASAWDSIRGSVQDLRVIKFKLRPGVEIFLPNRYEVIGEERLRFQWSEDGGRADVRLNGESIAVLGRCGDST